MSYPNFPDKYLEDFAHNISGLDESGNVVLEYKEKLPRKCIICYQSETLEYLLREYPNATKIEAWTLWGCKAFSTPNFVFVKMNGIGAPHATMMFEELIVLGIRDFINIGTAGGLNNPGIFVCNGSIRDEGVSHHYIKPEKYVNPDKQLTEKLKNSFQKLGIKYKTGLNWTIDTPFRETIAEIKSYREEGVETVEMEASALMAVAQLRQVAIACAFVTSDIVGENHENFSLNKKDFVTNGLENLAKAALLTLHN